MNDQIKNVSLKFACEADWDAMEWLDGAKHCLHCQKKVYDFTNAKQHGFLMIMAENNHNVCGRFRAEQMAVKHMMLPGWKKWASAAMILIGVNVFNSKAMAQDVKPNIAQDSVKSAKQDFVFGAVSEVPPEFPGGHEAFSKFIESNLGTIKGAAGKRVILQFVIEKDGSLTDVRVVRGVNKDTDDEAIRVMRSSPKWRPGTQNGKPLRVQYNLPVTFK